MARSRPKDPLDHDPASLAWALDHSGLTQIQLAKTVGISKSHMSEVLGGTRNAPFPLLLRFAEAFNCPVVMLERKRRYHIPAPEAEPDSQPAAAA